MLSNVYAWVNTQTFATFLLDSCRMIFLRFFLYCNLTSGVKIRGKLRHSLIYYTTGLANVSVLFVTNGHSPTKFKKGYNLQIIVQVNLFLFDKQKRSFLLYKTPTFYLKTIFKQLPNFFWREYPS